MGIVYEAVDEELDRRVALKILGKTVAGNAELLSRFKREAKLAASLSHANVATLYEVGEDDGQPYIAMELVEGETLEKMLDASGQLSLSDAINLARDMARALDHAHGRGVVHRDLKPSNIVVAKGGAKLLDFGIARPFHTDEDTETSAPTETGLTSEGQVVGTPAYMSPEQVRGEPVGPASDVFSFAVVVHETLTGARPFGGASIGEVHAAILRDEPPDVDSAPVQLNELLKRCLAKDPASRPNDGTALRQALREAVLAATATSSPDTERDKAAVSAPTARAKPKTNRLRWLALGAVAVVGVGAGAIVGNAGDDQPPSPPPSSGAGAKRQATALPRLASERLASLDGFIASCALSPDGKQLAFVSKNELRIQTRASGETRTLALDEGGELVDVSWFDDGALAATIEKDGRGSLARIEPDGASKVIATDFDCALVLPHHNRIVFCDDGLWTADMMGLHRERFAAYPDDAMPVGLAVSPDGRWLAVTSPTVSTIRRRLYLVPLDGHAPPHVVAEGARLVNPSGLTAMAWLTPDRLVIGRADLPPAPPGVNLWIIQLDGDGKPVGDPRQWTTWSGTDLPVLRQTSRDGELVAVRSRAQFDVFTANLKDGGRAFDGVTRRTETPHNERPSAWLATGELLYMADDTNRWQTRRLSRDGSAKSLHADENWQTWPQPGPNGSLLYWRVPPLGEGDRSIALMLKPEGQSPRVVLEATEGAPHRGRPPPSNHFLTCLASGDCVYGERAPSVMRLARLDLDTAAKTPLAELNVPRGSFALPMVSGREIAVTNSNEARFVLVDAKTGSQRQITTLGCTPQYVAKLPPLDTDAGGWLASCLGVPNRLVHISAKGAVTGVHDSAGWIGNIMVSPDGKQLAYGERQFDGDVLLLTAALKP